MNATTDVYDYQAGVSNWSRAMGDLKGAWRRRALWSDMAVRAFNHRYRGAVFGAFWLTITTAMTATGLGVLYGYLFGQPLAEHLPYVACAIIAWSMITGFATGGSDVFVGNAAAFKEFPLPTSLYVFRLTLTQIITVGYRFIVLVIIFVVFSAPLTWTALLSVAGFALIVWTGFWASFCLGVVNARYRDFGQLVSAFLMFMFFLTPIFWMPERLGEYAKYVNFNPFYHFIEVFRGPLLGRGDLLLHFGIVGAFAVLTPLAGISIFGRLSHRLPYWC